MWKRGTPRRLHRQWPVGMLLPQKLFSRNSCDRRGGGTAGMERTAAPVCMVAGAGVRTFSTRGSRNRHRGGHSRGWGKYQQQQQRTQLRFTTGRLPQARKRPGTVDYGHCKRRLRNEGVAAGLGPVSATGEDRGSAGGQLETDVRA